MAGETESIKKPANAGKSKPVLGGEQVQINCSSQIGYCTKNIQN